MAELKVSQWALLADRAGLLSVRVGSQRQAIATEGKKMSKYVEWETSSQSLKAPCCFHGGAFFEAIGSGFDTLERRDVIVNADVLDARFPPSPHVISALQGHLAWLVRTSPPKANGACWDACPTKPAAAQHQWRGVNGQHRAQPQNVASASSVSPPGACS